MKKVTFPHMGTSVGVFSDLIKDLGCEPIVPIRPNKTVLDLGVRYSPEFACFPFKALLGNYYEAAERGANYVVTSGGSGPCRAGLYGELSEKIMRSFGIDMQVIVFDSIYKTPLDYIKKINLLNDAKLSYWAIVQLVRLYWRKLQALDNIERVSHKVRPREIKKDKTTEVFTETMKWVNQAKTMKEVVEAERQGILALEQIPQDPTRQIVRVGIVGEIYVLLEPAINLEIEEILGNLGVEVDRSIYLTGWARDATVGHKDNYKTYAKPYLNATIGGHGQETIGHTIMYAQQGFGGVVQLAPFTCIPEIVTKTIMPKVTHDYGIPVLTFFLDEQTGKAGMQTRLEAFVDMLKRKQRMERVEQEKHVEQVEQEKHVEQGEGEHYARVSGN